MKNSSTCPLQPVREKGGAVKAVFLRDCAYLVTARMGVSLFSISG